MILAVGAVRGWREALAGTGAALGVLLLAVATSGTVLTRIPLGVLQIVVGALPLLFGLRRAILRAAGVIPVDDEAAASASQLAAMCGHEAADGWDGIAFGTAFRITMLEGVEVFIVVAFGAGGTGLSLPASLGALAALPLVAALGVLMHRPLSRVRENGLKFVVGVLPSAFGTFWFGEGIGIDWPEADWSIPALAGGFLAAGLVAVRLCPASPGRLVAPIGDPGARS